MSDKEEEQVFIRSDLNKTSTGNVAYYRIGKKDVDFLNRILEQHGDIEAVILSKKNGDYHFNIGFVIPDKKGQDN